MSQWKILNTVVAAVLAGAVFVNGETHTIRQVNNCGRGAPALSQNSTRLPFSGVYTSNGPFTAAIAWLDIGCPTGDTCGIVEMVLTNNGVSIADISLIPPNAFSGPIRFSFDGGKTCDGVGANCNNINCPPTQAAHFPEDGSLAVRICPSIDSGITITYC